MNQIQFSPTTVAAKSYESANRDKQMESVNERLPGVSSSSEDETESSSVMTRESQPSSSAASAPKTKDSVTRAESREMSSLQSQASTVPPPPSTPSTLSQDGGQTATETDFTTQAALGSVTAKQSNNIVNTRSYYDITFTTASGGSIKDIIIDFPTGTAIGVGDLLVERQGIGPGTAIKTGPLQITYTVTNPVNVPPGTDIRLELSTIDNPSSPGTNYKVIVTTKRPAGTTIDGSTQSTAYKIKQIGTGDIADGAVTNSKLGTFSVTNSKLDTFSVTNSKIAPDALSIQPSQVPGPVVNIPPSTLVEASAVCPSDTFIVGGGNIMGGNTFDMRYVDGVIFEFNTWRVRATNAGSGAMTVQAYAICIPSSFP